MTTMFIPDDTGYALRLLYKTISGTVVVSGVPVSRQVLVYKNKATTPEVDLYSGADGSFSVSVIGNSNDKFRIVIVGESGEYSKIFEDVVAG